MDQVFYKRAEHITQSDLNEIRPFGEEILSAVLQYQWLWLMYCCPYGYAGHIFAEKKENLVKYLLHVCFYLDWNQY